ncbi:MAG: response regulator transcription factor [Muribaculaceae bacterium]|nr:response regulator transcription factor [Muribaculaceae bacterium]
MKIAVVDDHDLIREGMKTVLMNHGAENVNIFGTGTELTASIDAGKSFDLYIIDLELPDIDGFDLIKRIRTRNHKARIIVSTVHDEIWTLRKLLAHHVNSIIYKSGNANELVTAISEILQGKNYYCEGVEQQLKMAEDDSLHPTTRELEVLNQIARGKTSREIAATLFVSDNTIEAHRKSLFTKLGAVNVADLIVKAMDKGYIRKNYQ